MPRLETEINQIYLTHPESKKSSLILYEEELNSSARLFILLELRDLQRKSEGSDLKKISEIILDSFRANKKLSGEALFESSLSQINQNLADLAHEGRKSWVGKFSAILGLKSSDNIFLANNGATQAFLLRKSELLEILASEKRGVHPLKSFTNFTQGKLQDHDSVIVTTSNIFNFISLELFDRILNEDTLSGAAMKISKILQDSMRPEESFSSFLLGFTKESVEPATPVIEAAVQRAGIYAPLPEELVESALPISSRLGLNKLPGLPKLKLPKLAIPNLSGFKFKKPQLNFYNNLSRSGKFFFISFTIFILLFLGNIAIVIERSQVKSTQNKITALATQLSVDLSGAESSLIYKNNDQALTKLAQAETDYTALQKLDSSRAQTFTEQLSALKDEINKVSTVTDPKVFATLKHDELYLTRASIGLLVANKNSNSLTLFDGATLTDYFLLNSLKNDIASINFFTSAGVIVSSADTIYHIDTTLKQFEPIVNVPNGALGRTQIYNGALYTINSAANQVIKTTFVKNKYTNVLINVGSVADLRDFGLDKDIYLLFADHLIKVTGGAPQSFAYPILTDPITNATRIFVGSNLYILEPNKKRVIILNKNGQLLNQIYFPSVGNLLDFSIDEAGHGMYLLDGSKVYKITF